MKISVDTQCEKLFDEYDDIQMKFWKDNVQPKLNLLYRQIDNDIRACIKEEIKKNGSIVKRYGDWAKFINQNFSILRFVHEKRFFYRKLYFQGKLIREYSLDWTN